ncbi:RDD family protein [Agrococcus sp. 1P02AA]|uniref:RDD family protein n=1 Tax=Agrococcus sp. 1P02AA TaxID=3132259 RepID=UPI0039A4ECA0
MIWEIEDKRTVIEGLDEDGKPDPAYAAALGLRPAPYGRRAIASIIEFALYAILQLPYWLITLPPLLAVVTGSLTWYGFFSHPNLLWMIIAAAVSFVFTTVFVIVQLVLHGRKGVTLGKAFVGIRSINSKTLAKPTIGRALLRGLLLALIFLVPLVGPLVFFLSPLFDGEKRGRSWLDKAAGMWVVDIRQGLDPYHEKRMRIARKTIAAEPEAQKSQLPSLATPLASSAPSYRPGARVSAGVVGAARPAEPGAAPRVGLPTHVEQPAPSHTVPGMPSGGARLGAYRPGELSGQAVPPAPSAPAASPQPSRQGDIVDSVPGREHAGAPISASPSASASASPPTPTAAREPAPAPAPPTDAQAAPIRDETLIDPDVDDGIDDQTVRRLEVVADDDLDVTRARSRAPRAVAILAFDTGDRFAITGAALIGRNPAPAAGEEVEHLLPIVDDTRSISKTHLLITAVPLAAVDRASTNGSSVIRGGAERPLAPGEPFALEPGDVVRFGDCTVAVEPGGAA